MAEDLSIKIMRLKRGMVYMRLGTLKKEEYVMVDKFIAPVKTKEHRNVTALFVMYELLVGELVSLVNQ